jgi:hypothetical protein
VVMRSLSVGRDDALGFMLGGLVAGEGYFGTITTPKRFQDGTPRLRFTFEVTMASRDRPLLEALHVFLSAGRITDVQPKNPKWLLCSTTGSSGSSVYGYAANPIVKRFNGPKAPAGITYYEAYGK